MNEPEKLPFAGTTLFPGSFAAQINWWTLLKWFVLIASYTFLIYKLLTFDNYSVLVKQFSQMPVSQFWWFLGVLILLPFNWLLESVKWRMLVSKVQQISYFESVKAVLGGVSAGFFTPNRIGELFGRIVFLDKENRKSGFTFSLVNSLSQNLVMALVGIPACIIFFIDRNGLLNIDVNYYLIVLSVCILFLAILFFLLPVLSKCFTKSSLFSSLSDYTNCLTAYSPRNLLNIIFVSFIRFIVFSTQFYFMLLFYGVNLDVIEALVAIPACYLFVTFTPSVAFSEAAVRSSYAVLFIGSFSTHEIPIILAGVSIWVVNFVLPMVFGSLVILNKKEYA